MIAIGIDIGGTHTRVGTVGLEHPCGRVLALRCCETSDAGVGGTLIDWIARAIEEVITDPSPERKRRVGKPCTVGVGLALPGIIDHARRELVQSVNAPFLEGRLLGDELELRTGFPVRLVTDAEAATWAEYVAFTEPDRPDHEHPRRLKPAARPFVHLRIGTGIGCGLVAGGELQELHSNRSGHLDVLGIDGSGNAPACPCGKRGCLETIASGRVLHERALREGYVDGLVDLQHAWERGDGVARAMVDQAGDALAIALTNLIAQFNTETVSIGGGVITALPCLLDGARRRVNSDREASSDHSGPTIVLATLGDNAGVIGAAFLASGAAPATT